MSSKRDSVRKNTFFPFPVGAYSPETSLEYGVAAIYSFYVSKTDQIERPSTLNFLGTHTTKNQTKLKLTSDIWSKENKYHYTTEFRYQDFPYYFYGIGNNTQTGDKDLINEKKWVLDGAVDKRIAKNYYVGLAAGIEKYTNEEVTSGGIFLTGNYYGKNGGKRAYIGIEQIYDSRDNISYTTKGLYGKLSFDYTPNLFGGTNFTGTDIDFDGRYFMPITSKITLAINGIYRHIDAVNVPFYLLPKLGGEDMMRGYYQGRYRDRSLIAGQSEIRYHFIPRFGIVAFGGLGAVYGEEKLSLDMLKPSYGAGLRYFFDLNKGLTLRLDYGFGQKVYNEKRQSGVYFSMDEAF
ncbi:BamA/TamA family outer membrane protein [Arachidicoccus sp.]|uniref:BamA/TamA family outer membrane protein n=1 Tax=Arachidicoccus sp. TaxID=1872624 RepID=UPI003D23B9DE